MGIGGLDKEFSSIFRRAFASRLFPPKIISQWGIKHVKGTCLLVCLSASVIFLFMIIRGGLVLTFFSSSFLFLPNPYVTLYPPL